MNFDSLLSFFLKGLVNGIGFSVPVLFCWVFGKMIIFFLKRLWKNEETWSFVVMIILILSFSTSVVVPIAYFSYSRQVSLRRDEEKREYNKDVSNWLVILHKKQGLFKPSCWRTQQSWLKRGKDGIIRFKDNHGNLLSLGSKDVKAMKVKDVTKFPVLEKQMLPTGMVCFK